MSAFICHPAHIKALAIYAATKHHGEPRVRPVYFWRELQRDGEAPHGNELATFYAGILYAENVRSVLYRYPDDTLQTAPGLIDKPATIEISSREYFNPPRLGAVDILNMGRCFEYQSCETDDWETTLAHRLLGHIQAAAIRELHGGTVTWEYCGDGWPHFEPHDKAQAA